MDRWYLALLLVGQVEFEVRTAVLLAATSRTFTQYSMHIVLLAEAVEVLGKADLEVPSLKEAPLCSIIMVSAVRSTHLCHTRRRC